MKRFISLSLVLMVSLSLFATTIVHVSDMHYISPSLFDYERLRKLSMEGDGKATHIMDKVMEKFIEEMLTLSPDAVVVTGDITYNGEKISHQELRAMFSTLEENGTKVFVLMGNHDTGKTPYALLEDRVVETDGISPMEAEELWMDYGYGEAVSKDPYSNSYMAKISEELWLIALDSNNGSGGSVRKNTLTWMESALKMASIKGKKVISLTHQNLFVHNPRYTFGYQINNSSQVVSLYKKYGVRLNLSGHLHIQHISTEEGIVEIAAESFSAWPLQYGVIDIGDDFSYSYSTREVDDESLRNEARLSFDSSTESKFAFETDAEDKEKMMEAAKALNREYFRGYVEYSDSEALDMWRQNPGLRITSYLENIDRDRRDYRTLTGTL